jgi:hypothetical protein
MQEVVGNEAAVSSAPARATSYLLESRGSLTFNCTACHFPLHHICSGPTTNYPIHELEPSHSRMAYAIHEYWVF